MTIAIPPWLAEISTPTFSNASEPDDVDAVSRRRREALRTFEKSLPPLYRWSRLDHPLLSTRVKLASLPSETPRAKSVVLFGPAGAGKTSLAIALLRALLEHELLTATLACDDEGERIARRYKFAHAHRLAVARLGGPAETSELKAAIRAPVLVLDNLSEASKIETNAIPDVIIERHAEDRTTWITTELKPEQLAKRYGGGIARRLFERAQVIRFGHGHDEIVGSEHVE